MQTALPEILTVPNRDPGVTAVVRAAQNPVGSATFKGLEIGILPDQLLNITGHSKCRPQADPGTR